jgi:hypothetical protein
MIFPEVIAVTIGVASIEMCAQNCKKMKLLIHPSKV